MSINTVEILKQKSGEFISVQMKIQCIKIPIHF